LGVSVPGCPSLCCQTRPKRGKEKKMAKCMTTDFEIWSDHGGNVHGSGTTYFKVPTAGL